MSAPLIAPEERFKNYVSKTETCWHWTGPSNQTGYGQLYLGRDPDNGSQRHVVAHRWAFEQKHRRPVKEGLVLDHICFNRKCVNPDHLREVTNQFNTFRRKGANSNSSTGMRNVYRKKWGNPGYYVNVTFDGQVHYGGSFVSIADAGARAEELRNQLWSAKQGAKLS